MSLSTSIAKGARATAFLAPLFFACCLVRNKAPSLQIGLGEMHSALLQRVRAPGLPTARPCSRRVRCRAADRPEEGLRCPPRPLYIPNRIDDPNYVRTLGTLKSSAWSTQHFVDSFQVDCQQNHAARFDSAATTVAYLCCALGVAAAAVFPAPCTTCFLLHLQAGHACPCRCASLPPRCAMASNPRAARSPGAAHTTHVPRTRLLHPTGLPVLA